MENKSCINNISSMKNISHIKEALSNAFSFRYACKCFDSRKIPNEDLKLILEIGRLSPSSYGMQPWRLIVVQKPELKEMLFTACNSQKQIITCSDLIVVCARTDMRPGNEQFEKVMMSRTLDDAKKEKIKKFLTEKLKDDKELLQWAELQCYIAATNMVAAAAMMKIDSCYIGAYDREGVIKALKLPKHIYPSIIITLGYRGEEQPKKERLSMEEVAEFR